MTKGEDFEVIILGGGVAGLLLASEISKTLDTVVIEKEAEIPLRKYWLTNKKSVDKNPQLKHCLDNYFTFMDFISYDLTKYRCYGDFYLWNTEKLISHLRDIILNNRGLIITGHRFYGYKYYKDRITIFANNNQYSGKLVIDCMGYSSPIISNMQVVDILGYYMLYGAILKTRKPIPPIGLFNTLMHSHPKYIEVFPKSNGYANAIIISPEKVFDTNSGLVEDFTFIINKSALSEYFYRQQSGEYELGGIIPIGRLRTQALRRIYFYGEANQLNPATTATGLTRILYSYKEISGLLMDLIAKNKLEQRDLNKIEIEYLSRLNRNFQLYLFKDVLKWNSSDFRRLIWYMNKLDNDTIYNIIFGDLAALDLWRPATLLNLIRSGNMFVLKPLIKSLF